MHLLDGSLDAHSSELVEALQRVREQLHSTRSSTAVCLICLENMRHDDAIWHCYRGCCCVLHLVCIQAWSRQQVAAATYTASSDPSRCSSICRFNHLCVLAQPCFFAAAAAQNGCCISLSNLLHATESIKWHVMPETSLLHDHNQLCRMQMHNAVPERESIRQGCCCMCRVKADDGAQASWGCPKCRTGYMPTEVPAEYRCFCGKQKDPPADPWLAPHTCGDICGKHLASGCDHTCVLLCHPGPCPPCPRQVHGTHSPAWFCQ